MPTSRPFAYNTGSTIVGTEQVGNLAVGSPTNGFGSTGLQWWMGPDEDLGYVIAYQQSGGTQPNPISIPAYVQFWRSSGKTDQGFLNISNSVIKTQNFTGVTEAKTYLNNNGYWTSYSVVTPTPTPSVTVTPTVTATPTPTPTQVVDAIRAQLSGSQLTAYDAATVGNWIKVTQTQYNNIVSNVAGATKKGNSDAQVATRDVLTSWSNYWIAFGLNNTPTFQINTGEYVIAMITEAWNQNNGTSQLGYTTSFTGSTITNFGGTAGPSTGGVRDYFVRKAPTDVATETRYPVLYMTVSPNAVQNWNGLRSNNNGTTWTQNVNNQTSKIQIVTTSTKSW